LCCVTDTAAAAAAAGEAWSTHRWVKSWRSTS